MKSVILYGRLSRDPRDYSNYQVIWVGEVKDYPIFIRGEVFNGPPGDAISSATPNRGEFLLNVLELREPLNDSTGLLDEKTL